MNSDQTPLSPPSDVEVLADRIHEAIEAVSAGGCKRLDPLGGACIDIAMRLAAATSNSELQVAAVLALADELDAEAHDRALDASVERRATKVHAAARIRAALGVEASDDRD